MAEKRLDFEDVEVGAEVPPLVRGPLDTPDIVRFSAAVENFEKLHHNAQWCKENGFPDMLVNGPLRQAYLASLLTEWIGESGFLKKLACSHRGMDLPGNTLTAKGRVTRKYEKDGLGLVECEVWVENQKGEITCPGTATVVLPRRGGPPAPIEYPAPPRARP